MRKASAVGSSEASSPRLLLLLPLLPAPARVAHAAGTSTPMSAAPSSNTVLATPPPPRRRQELGASSLLPVDADIWSIRRRLWTSSEEFRRQVRGRSGPNMYPHVTCASTTPTPIHDITDIDLDEQEEQRRKRRAQLGPGSSAADDPFASVLHRDAFLLFRTLCKLSMKGNPGGANLGSPSSVGGSLESRALDSKVLALELLLGQLETSGNSFRMGDKFIFAIKNYLCDSLIRNISLVGPTLVVNLSLRIFVALITHFKDNLKSEIEVFISSMFLPILEAASAVYEHRMLVLEVFARLCQDSYTVVELFINYDCSDDLSTSQGSLNVSVPSRRLRRPIVLATQTRTGPQSARYAPSRAP